MSHVIDFMAGVTGNFVALVGVLVAGFCVVVGHLRMWAKERREFRALFKPDPPVFGAGVTYPTYTPGPPVIMPSTGGGHGGRDSPWPV
jgi:hypothetical protein